MVFSKGPLNLWLTWTARPKLLKVFPLYRSSDRSLCQNGQERRVAHVPFRNSKLTQLLQEGESWPDMCTWCILIYQHLPLPVLFEPYRTGVYIGTPNISQHKILFSKALSRMRWVVLVNVVRWSLSPCHLPGRNVSCELIRYTYP